MRDEEAMQNTTLEYEGVVGGGRSVLRASLRNSSREGVCFNEKYYKD